MRRIVLIAWLLLPGAALVAQQANPAASVGPPRFTISGTVVNANGGQPIAHAQVNIQSVDGRGTWTARGDDVGRFAFAGIAPGKYLLAGEAHGFVRQAYDEHEGFSSAIVAGPGLVSEGLVFRLKPEAVITVKVRDEFEEPVRNGMATLFREAVEEGQYKVQVRAMAGLNDEGSCTFAHLPAGKYFVAIKARPWYAQPGLAPAGPSRNSGLFDATYPITYYSDATDAAAATAIPLQPGERALADMSLRAVPAARLEISLPPGLTGTQQSARLEQPSFNGFRMPVDGLNVRNTQDHIELSGFAPGHYILNLDSFPPQRVRTGLAGDPRFPLQQAKSGLAGDPGFGDRSRSSRYREIDVAGVTEIGGVLCGLRRRIVRGDAGCASPGLSAARQFPFCPSLGSSDLGSGRIRASRRSGARQLPGPGSQRAGICHQERFRDRR